MNGTEMQAVTQKYHVLNDTDHARMKQLRSERAEAKRNLGQWGCTPGGPVHQVHTSLPARHAADTAAAQHPAHVEPP